MRLILTDVDGTILPWGKTEVSPQTRQAFLDAKAAGHAVGVASGRAHSWVPAFFGGDETFAETAICSNGLEVWHDGACIKQTLIELEPLVALRDYLRTVPGCGLIVFRDQKPLLVEGSLVDLAQAFPRYAQTSTVAPLPLEPAPKANVFINGDLARTRQVVAELNRAIPELDFDVPQPGFSNVMPAGWGKGPALLWLRDYLDIAPSDVFVFGDAGNDLSMFDVVENSVAVANALPEAAAAARWHIGSVETDAVAKAIQALSHGEFPFTE